MNKVNNLDLHKQLLFVNDPIEEDLSIINELNKHFVNISDTVKKTQFIESNFISLNFKSEELLTNHEFDI